MSTTPNTSISDDEVMAFLLAHVDPHYSKYVLDTLQIKTTRGLASDPLVYGPKCDGRLQPLVRTLVAVATTPQFLSSLFELLTEVEAAAEHQGIAILRSQEITLTLGPTPVGVDAVGILNGPRAVTDLLLQPLTALCNLVDTLAEPWIELAARPEIASRVWYRTNQAFHFETTLEQRIREELGLPIGLHGSWTEAPKRME